MLMPGFQSRFLFVLAFFVVIFDVWFFALSIKVLAEKIKYGIDAFVGVMLSTTLKLLCVFAENTLEHIRSDDSRTHVPHFVYCFCIGQNKTTLSAQGVSFLFFAYKSEVAVEEELCQLKSVRQALKTTCHVAGIAQVCQSHFAVSGVGLFLNLNLIQFLVSSRTALGFVEALIFDLTRFVAVAHSFTLALDCELLGLVTAFTLSNETAFLDVEFVLKIWSADFDQDDFVLPLFLLERVNSADHWFQAFPWEFHARIFLNCAGFRC